jgi:hypothetical protein
MLGVRGHVRTLELGDMSPSRKAVTRHRTPNLQPTRNRHVQIVCFFIQNSSFFILYVFADA